MIRKGTKPAAGDIPEIDYVVLRDESSKRLFGWYGGNATLAVNAVSVGERVKIRAFAYGSRLRCVRLTSRTVAIRPQDGKRTSRKNRPGQMDLPFEGRELVIRIRLV